MKSSLPAADPPPQRKKASMNEADSTHKAAKEEDDPWRPSRTVFPNFSWRHEKDKKVIGLKQYGLDPATYEKRRKIMVVSNHSRPSLTSPDGVRKAKSAKFSVEEMEVEARAKAISNPFALLYLGNLAALKVMVYYLFTLETIISCAFTVALTVYWYYAYDEASDWSGSSMNFVLLAFALTAPIAAAMSMAFDRRERALISIAAFRSWSYHLYMAHCLWDWSDKGGRTGSGVDWVEHCDAVMAQLVGIGDELARFLSLPTTSRSRHRMTRQGRKEAACTIEVAYNLLESMATQRMTRLVMYSERLKAIGLPSGEVSRLRQYERFLSDMVEQLRMVKMYRTPQAFRSFARIFTLVLPPFYAPSYAQVARDVNSLGVGIFYGLITALGLTMLFESLEILEDPFTAFLALDGIDVKEEFEVLHFAQLLHTRKLVYPNAPEYPAARRAAMTSKSKRPPSDVLGLPPMQIHHAQQLQRVKTAESMLSETEDNGIDVPTQVVDGVVDQESLISYLDEDIEAEDELGPRMDDDREASLIRTTGFAEEEEGMLDGASRRRSEGSEFGLRGRWKSLHSRNWSHG